MGFEDEVEQSMPRPLPLRNGRSKRTCAQVVQKTISDLEMKLRDAFKKLKEKEDEEEDAAEENDTKDAAIKAKDAALKEVPSLEMTNQRAPGHDTQGTRRPKGPRSVGPFDFYWRRKAFCLHMDASARVADAIDSKSIAERHEV